MTWPAIVAIVLAALGIFTVGFLTLWHRVSQQLRAMEQFEQRRTEIDRAQLNLPRPRRVK